MTAGLRPVNSHGAVRVVRTRTPSACACRQRHIYVVSEGSTARETTRFCAAANDLLRYRGCNGAIRAPFIDLFINNPLYFGQARGIFGNFQRFP